ncbi:MAG: tripartite tricarboxylate transporter substrate binding protein [Rhodospirillaceae bacterium]|nr:tripartite tricarboxylate transporter substrate binding protein [Rhodospirillaceae bacterium]
MTGVPGKADGWPQQPVDYIIPFGYGGESGIAARLQQPVFTQLTGHDLVISHKPGGGGAVVWSELNNMKGDGNTIVGINLPHLIIQPVRGARYKTEEIAALYLFHYTPNALIVSSDSPYETLDDLIKDAQERPNQVLLSGSGKGTANHLAQVRFDNLAGIETEYRAYKGTGESIAALLSGTVDAAWAYTTVALQQQADVRVLGVAMEERHPSIPDAPTFRELKFDMVDGAYRGIAVPNGTPEPIKRAISKTFATLNKDAAFVQKKQSLGFVPVDIGYDKLPAFIAERTQQYRDLAKRAGLTE